MKLLRKLFKTLWYETTLKVNENVAFESGGFLISLGLAFLAIWLFTDLI